MGFGRWSTRASIVMDCEEELGSSVFLSLSLALSTETGSSLPSLYLVPRGERVLFCSERDVERSHTEYLIRALFQKKIIIIIIINNVCNTFRQFLIHEVKKSLKRE